MVTASTEPLFSWFTHSEYEPNGTGWAPYFSSTESSDVEPVTEQTFLPLMSSFVLNQVASFAMRNCCPVT